MLVTHFPVTATGGAPLQAPDAQRLLKDACHVATLAPREERDNWARAAQEQYPEGEGNEYSHLRVADFSDEASALPPEELQVMLLSTSRQTRWHA